MGLTTRSLVVALVLTVVAGLWVRQAEIVVLSTQISESVPAIPGLAALVLLLGINGLIRFIPRVRPFTRAEILVVFLFVTISSTIMGIGVVQFLISLIATPFYIHTDNIESTRPFLPRLLVPHDTQAIQRLYEHAPDGRVPWHVWITPGLCWLGFFLALWWTLYCLLALFYRAWAEDERLSFPLVALAMEMTESRKERPFFRNKLVWLGFALAAVYNLINIAHAFSPPFPAIGKEVDLSGFFTNLPWSEMKPISFYIRPELVGLGFLVSTEISLTVWASYLVLKLVAVFGAANGSPPGLLPMDQEQGIGAYLTLACLLTWLARRRLQSALRAALGNQPCDDGPEGVRYRWLFLGLLGGFVCSWGFMRAAGMAGWVALVYLGIVVAVALVYGRLRAEAGVPLIWLFPFGMQKDVLLYTLGSQPFVRAGPTTLPVLALFTFLARGYYPEMTGYQIEGIEIARRAQIRPARLVFALCLAVGVAFVLGWINHLIPYYRYGAAQLRGGIWGDWLSLSAYRDAATFPSTPKLPQLPRIFATAAGGIVVFTLWLLRLRFTGFWFHPLGYVMTCSYGSLIWGSFLVVWVLKSLILHYGGLRLYKQFVPFFLGLALGHFAIAGILWGLTGAWAGDAVQGYPVYFG